MPKPTRPSSKSSEKRNQPCCGCNVVAVLPGLTILNVWGPKVNGILFVRSPASGGRTRSSHQSPCEEQAELAAEVAYNNCILNGGGEEYCTTVRQNVYQQVLAECEQGPGGGG